MNKPLNLANENDPAFCPNGCSCSYKGIACKSNLIRHLKHSCGVHPKFQCIVCPRTFRRNESLQYHLMNSHRHT